MFFILFLKFLMIMKCSETNKSALRKRNKSIEELLENILTRSKFISQIHISYTIII